MTTLDVVTAVLLLTGAASCLLGAVGLVRFPDVPSRLQAATKPQTLGLVLILVGTAIRLEFSSAATLALVILFQVITAPVISQIVGRSAYRAGTMRRGDLVADELAGAITHDDDPSGRAPSGGSARSSGARSSGARSDGTAADGSADGRPGPAPGRG